MIARIVDAFGHLRTARSPLHPRGVYKGPLPSPRRLPSFSSPLTVGIEHPPDPRQASPDTAIASQLSERQSRPRRTPCITGQERNAPVSVRCLLLVATPAMAASSAAPHCARARARVSSICNILRLFLAGHPLCIRADLSRCTSNSPTTATNHRDPAHLLSELRFCFTWR